MAIVSLFVLTGFGVDVFGECCGSHGPAETEHSGCAPDDHDQAPDKGDGCQCICHVVLTTLTAGTLWAADAAFVPTGFLSHTDEFPPDAVPLGIDHPPQIA